MRVASTDGLKHHHPSEHTLRWVVHSRADQDEYTIHLNHDVGFARTALEALQRGRKFRVAVRSASERAETVSLLA